MKTPGLDSSVDSVGSQVCILKLGFEHLGLIQTEKSKTGGGAACTSPPHDSAFLSTPHEVHLCFKHVVC